MSEPSSVYARIHISEGALAAYQASIPELPSTYHDWLAWLEDKQYYGKKITESDINELTHGKATIVHDALIAWMDYPDLELGQTSYDAETQSWRIGFLECSENYSDYMVVLSFLRGITHFKDVPGEDFILITPYIWGGPPEAYIVVTAGSSSLVAEIPEEAVEEAHGWLQNMLEAMGNEFGGPQS